jgi:hypothetical protein
VQAGVKRHRSHEDEVSNDSTYDPQNDHDKNDEDFVPHEKTKRRKRHIDYNEDNDSNGSHHHHKSHKERSRKDRHAIPDPIEIFPDPIEIPVDEDSKSSAKESTSTSDGWRILLALVTHSDFCLFFFQINERCLQKMNGGSSALSYVSL